MNSFKILPATKEDVPVILNFIKELAEFENLHQSLVADTENLEESLFGKKRYAEVIIGYWNDTPISYALFIHNFSTLIGKQGLFLVDMYVQSNMRKKGIGRKMFSYLAKIAIERNCGRFEWSVLKDNQTAIALYEKLGAKPMIEWIGYRLTENQIKKLADE